MRLNGQRILIRDINFKDLDDFYNYAKDENVGPNAGWKPVPNLDIARKMISSFIIGKETFAIILKDEKKLIGTISTYSDTVRKYKYTRQLGFSISSAYWGCGYAKEAIDLIINYLFTKTDIEVIEVGHHSDNYRSKRVIEKCGFLYDGRLTKYKKLYDGRIIDADFYSMTREDYERSLKYEKKS